MAFTSIEQWLQWAEQNPWVFQQAHVEELAQALRREGFACPIHNCAASPRELETPDSNYREGFRFRGLNCRLRAVWLELCHALLNMRPEDARIYAPEAVTEFACQLAHRYPQFIGSEYHPPGRQIRHEDLACLSFSDAVFDLAVVNEVFEHVPDLDRVLRELLRTLRPGGRLVSTFPFNIGGQNTLIKARETSNGTEFLAPPEYHGDPINPKGSLVYQIPGWDILEKMRDAGWSRVEMVMRISAEHGIIAANMPGVFVLVATQ
ncbi:class I SAM-dependent methyltransferase [Humidesulfovibrio idahonensis]